jgi:hypothetical protein
MIKFKIFEATLKDSLSKEYLDEYTQFMTQKYQGQLPQEFMQSVVKMFQLQSGNEEKLENIAKKIIFDFYGSILDDVKFDAKIVEPGDDEQIEMNKNISFEKEPNFEIKKQEDIPIKLEIDKRKIVNNIIQGESYNTFKIFQLAKNDINKIDPELSDLYGKIIDDSYTFYWRLPESQQVEMMKNNPQFGNYVQIIYNDGITIKVRALDMAALIHEMVKGVYELISLRGIPEDKEIAEVVLKHTDTYWDEIEDLKYGPKIASDIRDFLNKNPKINDYPNLREFVFGSMVDPKITSNEEFIELIKGILTNSNEARKKIDRLIDLSIEEIRNYESSIESETNDIDFTKYFTRPEKKNYSNLTEIEFKSEYDKLEIQLNNSFDVNDMDNVRNISSEMKKLKNEYKKKYNKELV